MVSKVLEGSVRKAANRLRITAQLINTADGYHIWSEQYDRELDDAPQGVYTQPRESTMTSQYQSRRCTTARNMAAGSVLRVAGSKFPFGPNFGAALFVEELLAALWRGTSEETWTIQCTQT